MQELCLKNCDQDAAGQKLENLSMVQRGYGLGADRVQERVPGMLNVGASAVKAPRLAIPLASSNELTNDPSWDCEADAASAALAPYPPGTAARVTVIPVTQVGVQRSQTG